MAPHPIRRANFAKHRTSLWTALKGVRHAFSYGRFVGDFTLRMPGFSYSGSLPPLTAAQQSLSTELSRDVHELAGPLLGRNQFHVSKLRDCEAFLGQELTRAGLHVTRHPYTSMDVEVANLHAEVTGTTNPEEILIFGAHYDAVELRNGPCPAANDNGSGVATVLALARRLASCKPKRTIRFALWVNEEPPFFYTHLMGSVVDADRSQELKEKVVGVLTPETLGHYSDEKGSQSYPVPGLFKIWYPSRGDFVAFVGMDNAGPLIRDCVRTFRTNAKFPSIGAGLPGIIPMVGASDHWSYWRCGYPALMITDTAPFRYKYYHTPEDTPDKMDFTRFARVVDGLEHVVRELAGASPRVQTP
jgi:hypothetical protein